MAQERSVVDEEGVRVKGTVDSIRGGNVYFSIPMVIGMPAGIQVGVTLGLLIPKLGSEPVETTAFVTNKAEGNITVSIRRGAVPPLTHQGDELWVNIVSVRPAPGATIDMESDTPESPFIKFIPGPPMAD